MFIENTKAKRDKARTLRYGVGVNDAAYAIHYKDTDGKQVLCPYYKTWVGMLRRCYSTTSLITNPTYTKCTVDPSWFLFSTFRAWMQNQSWQGRVLDKDLRVQGNTVYGPDTCLFIPHALNNLLCLSGKRRGKYPLGVSCRIRKGHRYITAQCSFYGKHTFIGHFPTVEEAALAYKNAKLNYITELANNEPDLQIKQALLRLF